MGLFTERIKQLRGVTEEQIEAMTQKVMKRNGDFAILLIQDQMGRGQDAFGKSIGKYNSKAYAAFKKTLNPLGVVDLRLHGDFWEGMYFSTEVFPFLIDSKDSKRNKLFAQYGPRERIFNLQDKNLALFLEACTPGIQQGYRRLLRIR